MTDQSKLLPRDILGVEITMKSRLHRALPIHKMAASGDCEGIIRLVQAGCSPSLPNRLDGKNSPLHYAAVFNQPETVYLLVRLGAIIDAEGLCGFSPIGMAVRGGYKSVVEVLVKWGASLKLDRFLLPSAIHNLDESIIFFLFDHGAIFYYQRDKDNALVDACFSNKKKVVHYLLQNGANPWFNPSTYLSLIAYLARNNCSLDILKELFYAQLRLSEPDVPSPLRNESKVKKRAIRKQMKTFLWDI